MATAPVLVDDGLELRPLVLGDAATWKAGEDEEQIRWFEAPGPAPIENVIAAIRRWRAGWADDGPVRHWGIWSDDQLVGGVELRMRDDASTSSPRAGHLSAHGLSPSGVTQRGADGFDPHGLVWPEDHCRLLE